MKHFEELWEGTNVYKAQNVLELVIYDILHKDLEYMEASSKH
jgi:hypothetical protein